MTGRMPEDITNTEQWDTAEPMGDSMTGYSLFEYTDVYELERTDDWDGITPLGDFPTREDALHAAITDCTRRGEDPTALLEELNV